MTREHPKPAAVQKLRVYEILYSLNQGFEQVLADLRRLQEFPFFRRELLRALLVVVEETRAWVNSEVAEVMHDREQADWTHFGRLRRQWERRFEDPAESAAAGRSRKPAKPAGKRRGKGAGHV